MGYYTQHELEVINGNDFVTDYKKEISLLSNYGDCFSDRIKWYEHEKNMREFSKKHPNTLFKLLGFGEDSDDVWHEYYLNGKMQKEKAIITFNDYDPLKLS